MDETCRVHGRDCRAGILDEATQLCGCQRLLGIEHRGQRRAFESLHGQIRQRVAGSRGIEQLRDVRIAHACQSCRFASKPCDRTAIAQSITAQQLERSANTVVADRIVDLTHAAARDEITDAIATDLLSAEHAVCTGNERTLVLGTRFSRERVLLDCGTTRVESARREQRVALLDRASCHVRAEEHHLDARVSNERLPRMHTWRQRAKQRAVFDQTGRHSDNKQCVRASNHRVEHWGGAGLWPASRDRANDTEQQPPERHERGVGSDEEEMPIAPIAQPPCIASHSQRGSHGPNRKSRCRIDSRTAPLSNASRHGTSGMSGRATAHITGMIAIAAIATGRYMICAGPTWIDSADCSEAREVACPRTVATASGLGSVLTTLGAEIPLRLYASYGGRSYVRRLPRGSVAITLSRR